MNVLLDLVRQEVETTAVGTRLGQFLAALEVIDGLEVLVSLLTTRIATSELEVLKLHPDEPVHLLHLKVLI